MSTAFGGAGAANGFGGTGQQTDPGNAGTGQQGAGQQQQQAPAQQQQQGQAYLPGQQQAAAPGQQQQIDEFGHRIRSALTSAEQNWQQQNAPALQLAQALKQMGRDPSQVLQQIQAAQQQAQFEAQQQQAQGMGVNPQLLQYMQGLEQQVQSVNRVVGEQRLIQAEQELSGFAKNFGLDYNGKDPYDQAGKTVMQNVREFAYNNNVRLDVAFRTMYFDRLMQVSQQQAQGQQLAAMQGRGPAPVSTAVPGSQQQGPVNYLAMSDKDFEASRLAMRNQHYQR